MRDEDWIRYHQIAYIENRPCPGLDTKGSVWYRRLLTSIKSYLGF